MTVPTMTDQRKSSIQPLPLSLRAPAGASLSGLRASLRMHGLPPLIHSAKVRRPGAAPLISSGFFRGARKAGNTGARSARSRPSRSVIRSLLACGLQKNRAGRPPFSSLPTRIASAPALRPPLPLLLKGAASLKLRRKVGEEELQDQPTRPSPETVFPPKPPHSLSQFAGVRPPGFCGGCCAPRVRRSAVLTARQGALTTHCL